MIRAFSTRLGARNLSPMIYAFEVGEVSGRPILEVGNCWEQFPDKVDTSTRGRRWDPGRLTMLVERTDSSARRMLVALGVESLP